VCCSEVAHQKLRSIDNNLVNQRYLYRDTFKIFLVDDSPHLVPEPGTTAGMFAMFTSSALTLRGISMSFDNCSGGVDQKSDSFGKIARSVAFASGRPNTFAFAVTLIVIWAVSGPIFQYSDTWQLVINTGTTIVTFLMVFLIQNTQNRDSAAVHLKLDEIIRAIDAAGNEAMSLEEKSQDELDEIKTQYADLAKTAKNEAVSRKAS
jgi:low affinity Fe/Cu permease